MDPITDEDWKKTVGFPINYSSQSSDDSIDNSEVVMRHPRQSSRYLLADGGDGAEADLLGSTPPRAIIRHKERRRNLMDTQTGTQKILRAKKTEDVLKAEQAAIAERIKKRANIKLGRTRARDYKQDLEEFKETKADSLPPTSPQPTVPTLVESCSRFMSLTSKLKCPEECARDTLAEERGREGEDELPSNRVNFHRTFCLLINMGNIDKGCKRTISREEQVWQNELKDLIWLELQARIAGRTLAEQDEYLCAQRNIVPTIVRNIIDYRFVGSNECKSRSKRLCVANGSKEDLTADHTSEQTDGQAENEQSDDPWEAGCVSLTCEACAADVGRAMREVATLLDSFYNAVSLYPSSKAMTVGHPLVATHLFNNRLKAMCLWYNVALHMRLKMAAVRRMLRTMRRKGRASTDSDTSRRSSECLRTSQVRFNINGNPTDSSNSDSSLHSEVIKEEAEGEKESEEGKESVPSTQDSGVAEKSSEDEVDSRTERGFEHSGQVTPEIVISETRYGTSDTAASSESGYASVAEAEGEDVFEASVAELTQLRLLGKCHVSPYREYHYEMLKTQGVRRCMAFINKIRKNVLNKVYMTLQKPDSPGGVSEVVPKEEAPAAAVFEDTRDEDETPQRDREPLMDELQRYGCWSEECLAMRLPSYRSHFLLLSSICMEAVHDYLTMRLESRPDHPSCLTVKQLIHELKEGLDIATEVRADFVRNVEAALAGRPAARGAREDLRTLIRTYDNTVETVLKQYLSYLTTMSETEALPRARVQAEWQFAARLARRGSCAHLLAPAAFTKIVCNQMERVKKQFQSKSENLKQMVQDMEKGTELKREMVYLICRETQALYAGNREAMLQAAAGARALAARLARAPHRHYRPLRQDIFNKLMEIREFIVQHTNMVLERSRLPEEESGRELHEGLVTRVRELLLQMFKLGFEIHKELQRLSESAYGREAAGGRRGPLGSLGSPARSARARFARADSIDDDPCAFDDKLFGNLANDNHTQNSIELLLSGEAAIAEEVEVRGCSGREGGGEQRQWAALVARAVIQFARCWMQFVVERCDRGRGLRPRWASQGLEFLMLACDPCNTKHLSEEEFKELEAEMDGCISHVVGSRRGGRELPAPPSPRAMRPRRLLTPVSGNAPAGVPTPPTPPTEPDPLLSFRGLEQTNHSKRVMEALERVETAREEALRARRVVGRVLRAHVHTYEPKLRQLTFKWQRGLKIGAGTFGKVYTVVNTESGQLLAMKELSVGAGDRRALQRAANELRVLEGIRHPHLVRYYGCELHREEMLLFMELCVEGSLETLVAGSGALPEHTVRRYTKQLLSAVAELHARAIAHRDIKSGNIFLTNEGHCLKLGDFGCAVKIRANTTAPGELQGFVGTQAYMAPEVFMKSSGHGRAADIWSLGCVVTEMASGKRPFSEYDSNYQIMFVVGMGGRPEIPSTLSEEGQQFCLACLTHDPDERPRAETLSLHHFLMIKSDEDCKCEPAFLI